jgi:hypothetical protein
LNSHRHSHRAAVWAAIAVLALGGCGRQPAGDAPPKLTDPTAGVTLELPDTARSHTVPVQEDFTTIIPYAPNQQLVYMRIVGFQPMLLDLPVREGEVSAILADRLDGFLPTYREPTTVPGSDDPAYLYGGRDRDGNGLAGFFRHYGKTKLVFLGLLGPAVKETDAAGVMAALAPKLSVDASDGNLSEVIQMFHYAYRLPEGDKADYMGVIDAAQGFLAMRDLDFDNYRKALWTLIDMLLELDERHVDAPNVRARAISALSTIFDTTRVDQLRARRQFEFAIGSRDVATARKVARFLDALDSPMDPCADACSRRRWNRIQALK